MISKTSGYGREIFMVQEMPRIKQLNALGLGLLQIWIQALLLASCVSLDTCYNLSECFSTAWEWHEDSVRKWIKVSSTAPSPQKRCCASLHLISQQLSEWGPSSHFIDWKTGSEKVISSLAVVWARFQSVKLPYASGWWGWGEVRLKAMTTTETSVVMLKITILSGEPSLCHLLLYRGWTKWHHLIPTMLWDPKD